MTFLTKAHNEKLHGWRGWGGEEVRMSEKKLSKSTIQRAPAQKCKGRKLFSDVSTEKPGPDFFPELIKRLDCQMKMEHKNSPMSTETIQFTSAKSQLNIHAVFILLGLKHLQHQSYKSSCCREGHSFWRSLGRQREKKKILVACYFFF